ncbi:MBOAT family O-acyltransferase [Dechloromonas denitrificans]|uniref:MBOAT family O-acyltransferase n=1 Tax=Dechloromonas denitrificans TaxID=281362 RepID=UPI001CFB1F41|nr:MBOAT family O-acyltransferase [Dechloromonas denitrificans]UCV06675.1 MBOAT family protein [Dechloromonas denitrificans]
MSYSSLIFVVFFCLVFGGYYCVHTVGRQVAMLVLASLVFYAWESPPLLGVFLSAWLATSLASYAVARSGSHTQARCYATLGVAINLCLLGFFKYKFLWLGGLAGSSQAPATLGEWLVLAPLPIGVSFYTFHGISLVVDVYRKSYTLPKPGEGFGLGEHLRRTLLYLVFFPQLIAGPIIKAKDFFPQVGLKRLRDVDFISCFRILVLGYFLKSVVADNLAEQTAWMAYPYFERKSSVELLIMLYGYSAQIFADFAGYSLIAIGLAKLLGYRLPNNFNFPYLSGSVAEFWRRWHISLSSWLRDYLYIPLGGNRRGWWRTNLNLLVVMLLGGLWHGAAWSFAVWGLWHGFGLALERPWLESGFMRSERPAAKLLRIFVVFNFASFGWLLFRLQEIDQASRYAQLILHSDVKGGGLTALSLIFVYGSVVALYHVAHVYRGRISTTVGDWGYGVMLFLIVTNQGPVSPFIYFQF